MQPTKFRPTATAMLGLALLCTVTVLSAQQGGTLLNGSVTDPTVVPNFLFEPEFPLGSLKDVPTWNELEQLLDNPYRVTLCSNLGLNIPGTTQISGSPFAVIYPSYCSNGVVRRPGFGVTLPPLLVHPLNYNATTGEEMRLLNPGFPGARWIVPDELVQDANDPNLFVWTYRDVVVSPGSGRVEETAIDNNGPIGSDPLPLTSTCIVNLEAVPPEGSIICGGDPGEPRYFGFGVLRRNGYSTPGVPGGTVAPCPDGRNQCAGSITGLQLFDPTRGAISPRDSAGNGGLRKPSLRVAPWGTPSEPGYLVNTDPAAVVSSNENDFVQNRQRAIELGKALFWDMQVGSDGVQSCGTCHFHAGADNRTKNQMNPNHLSGDFEFEVRAVNDSLVASDFPFHKLRNPEIAGDPKCSPPLHAKVDAGVLENNPNGVNSIVCHAANILDDKNVSRFGVANDVASSMGVKFGKFRDIELGLVPNSSGVGVVKVDLRSLNAAENVDPIPGFAGTDGSGHQFRRVEPRNTPTVFAAALNFDNFWDGRARHDFNGGSVFGASDPQAHVWVHEGTSSLGNLVPTRQIIRFVSMASLATGPALSEFEMSFIGRNWAKLGKKLLQGTLAPSADSVTPLGNQLVDATDSVLGLWSNQGGSQCAALGRPTTVGKPGLCTTYQEMIRRAFFPRLWDSGTTATATSGSGGYHLHGHPAVCTGSAGPGEPTPAGCDPFDGYVVDTPEPGPPEPDNTNAFTQMEANMPLFFGLSIQVWGTILVPDDTPFDQFLDRNPDMFESIGEAGEIGLVGPLPVCTSAGQHHCFREVGNFKRDANLDCNNQPAPGERGIGGGGTQAVIPCAGTRSPGAPDPLLGMDIFQGSNFSLKNPNFRAARCGECHAGATLTDNTMPFTSKVQLGDFIGEFIDAGNEALVEPLGRTRVISGFLLESELNENGQDAIERRIINQSIVPCPTDGLAYPDALAPGSGTGFGLCGGAGQSFFDNGVYNLGVTRCEADQSQVTGICDDNGRGNTDPFGWPLSLAALLMKNLGGIDQEPGTPLMTFDPSFDPECAPECSTGGLFDETAQDQEINPGEEGEPVNPLLPPYLAPWANAINVGDTHPDMDEADGGLNTLTDLAMLEGFGDILGPFNPAGVINENMNNGNAPFLGTWPIVNRVGRFGSFKAPQLREVELTGPYFHNGGKLTLRQVVDFYTRGGDFPVTNAEHRDFNIINLNVEAQSNLTEEEKVALVDFLLELTDDRVAFERAPFDHPEIFAPLDGTAPENTFGRPGFLANIANGMFRDVAASGAAGIATRLPAFLGISNERLVGAAAFCGEAATSQYCR